MLYEVLKYVNLKIKVVGELLELGGENLQVLIRIEQLKWRCDFLPILFCPGFMEALHVIESG